MSERQPIWSLPPKAATVYFILFPALTIVGLVFVVSEQVSSNDEFSPAVGVAIFQGTAAVAFASAAVAFIIVDVGGSLMGLAVIVQEFRERKRQEAEQKRQEAERKIQEDLADARREERERIVAFYREHAAKTGQVFVEPPEDTATQNGSPQP